MSRHWTLWLAIGVATALGLWFGHGVLDIVASPRGAVRIAMLPPVSHLAAVAALLTVVAILAARLRRDPEWALPLLSLGVLVVPFLPWMADRWPVLRVAGGPARPLLWFTIAGLTIGRFGVGWLGRLSWRRPSVIVFLVSALAYGGAAWKLHDSGLFPGGDEPHYLVITQSLLHDGDFQIENNHQREEYRAYYSATLRPDYLSRGLNGQIYSVHPVGLPILAVPAFAIGGYIGVMGMLVLMAAAAATLLWRRAFEVTGSASAATFGWAATALTAPFLFNSFTVYPEIPAALAVMIAFAWRPQSTSTLVLIARGLAIGALPWLSTKYVPMAAALGLIAAFRVGWRPASLVALAGSAVVLIAGWFAFFYRIWGTFSPAAAYGGADGLSFATLLRGAPGLLFDQEYGIVPVAPAFVLGIVGLVMMWRARDAAARLAGEIALTFVALLLMVGAFRLWWGGSAVPGRPVASGVLLLGVPIAFLATRSFSRIAVRAFAGVLLIVSLSLSIQLATGEQGRLLHNERDGSATILEWMSPTWPIWSAFPSFLVAPLASAWVKTLAWLALIGVIAGVTSAARRRTMGAAATVALFVGILGSATLVSVADSATALQPDHQPDARSRVPLLDSFDASHRPTVVVYDPFSRITAADALARVTLVARPGMREASQPIDLLWRARFALPAGEYRVQITRAGGDDAHLGLQLGRSGPPVEDWVFTGNAFDQRFTVPVDTNFVGIRASPDVGASGGELRLTPLHVVDEHARPTFDPVLAVSRNGDTLVITQNDDTFPESRGYWTRGHATALVTYAWPESTGASRQLQVSCGSVPNEIAFSTRGWSERLAVNAGETREVTVPGVALPGLATRVAPLTINVARGFVPADLDRSVADRRFLGCWIVLEPSAGTPRLR